MQTGNRIMYNRYFVIKHYPHDIYNAVGQIIKNAQEWEQGYKELALILDIPVKKISNSSLNKLNEALKKNDCISERDYQNLKAVIKIRNYINHEFYLSDFQISYDCYEQKIEALENILNSAHYLIFEATDFIENMKDKLRGCNIMRPTIFD